MNKLIEKIRLLVKTGFFHIFGSSIINKVITFLSSIVLVRILSKPEYGVFTYAWNIYCIVLLFSGMGVESGALQLSSEHSGDTEYGNRVSDYCTRFGLKFNAILVVVLIAIGLLVPLKIEAGRKLLCFLCLLPIFQFLFGMMSSYLRAQKRNQEYSKLQVINTVVVFITSVICAFFLREAGLVAGHYFGFILTLLVGYRFFHIRLVNKDKSDLGSDTKPLLKIAFITMVNNGLSQLMYLLDVFVLGIVDPNETILASYKVATMIPSALAFIPMALITYLYPFFAEHKDDGKWCINRYKQILLGLGGFNLVISMCLFFGARLIVCILFGEQYSDAVPVFRLLAINYFFSGTFRILSGNLLVTQRKLKFNLFVAIVSSITNVVADFLFIQWWGSMGAAFATVLVVLVSSVLSTSYLIITFKRKIKPDEKNT